MSSDNTTLNPGYSGDTIRDLARLGGTVKTQVLQIDVGGPSANAENLVVAGQQAMASSIPVTIAGDQPATPADRMQTWMIATQLNNDVNTNPANGFVPMEIPAFLTGL